MANNQREGAQGEDTPEFVTKDEMLQLISQTVNSAFTQRSSAFERKIEALLSKVIPQTAQVEQEESVKPGRVPNAEIMSMKKQLDEMKAEKEAEYNKRRETVLRQKLSEQLERAGTPKNLVKAAVALLISENKAVGYTADEYADDKEKVVFRGDSGEEDLSAGLGKWLRSDEGSSFLPPRGAQGSGDKSYNLNKASKQTPISNDALAGMLRNAF